MLVNCPRGNIYRCGDPNTKWAIPVQTTLNIYILVYVWGIPSALLHFSL